MIVHVFNSSVVSGPEKLVLPALATLSDEIVVILLEELRCGDRVSRVKQYCESLGLRTVSISVGKRVDLVALRQFGKILSEYNAEILHAHDCKASIYSLLANRFYSTAKSALVSTHHGVRGRPGIVNKIYERVYRHICLPFFDRILAVCSSDAMRLKGSLGLRQSEVICHLNGAGVSNLNSSQLSENSEKFRQILDNELGLSLDPGSFIIGVVGRLSAEKRHDRAVSVAAELSSAGIDYRLIFFGSGPLEVELQKKVIARGLENWVIFAGYRVDAAAEVAGLDLLMSLSDYEGLPVNLIEAGWAGTPILATAVDGVNDLIPTEEYGSLVDVTSSDDAIACKVKSLIHDKTILAQQSSRMRDRVERSFSQASWLRGLLEVYQNCNISCEPRSNRSQADGVLDFAETAAK